MKAALLLALALAAMGTAQASWAGLLAPAAPAFDAAAPVFQSAGLPSLTGTLAGAVGEAPDPPTPQPSATHTCVGTAPLTLTCQEPFTADPGATYRLTNLGGTGFTGTVSAALMDGVGHVRTLTCSYTLFVGGVTPSPSCSEGGSNDLQAGALKLLGTVAFNPETQTLAAGYWEVGVTVG